MRGTETKQATMLSLLSPEQRVPRGPSAAPDQAACGCGAAAAFAGVRPDVLGDGAAFGAAGAAAQSQPADGVLLGAQRAALLRAARLQSDVSLVPRHEHDRGELRPQHL